MKTLQRCTELPAFHGGEALYPPVHNWLVSHNCYGDRHGTPIQYVVVHATEGSSTSGCIATFESRHVGTPIVIPHPGENAHGQWVWRCFADAAKGAQVLQRTVKLPSGRKVVVNNSNSIGVEIVNAQTDSDPFSPWQVKAMAALTRYWWAKYNIVAVMSHAYEDPGRKTDPGSTFPWNDLLGYVMQGDLSTKVIGPRGEIVACNPVVANGKCWVDLRPAAQSMGYLVDYNNGVATLRKQGVAGFVASLFSSSSASKPAVVLNGNLVPCQPAEVNGTLRVWIAPLAEALGYRAVDHLADSGKIYITQ